MPLTSKGIRNHSGPVREQTVGDKAEAERLANTYNAGLEEQNSRIRQLLNLCPECASRFASDEVGEITGRQSCDICKERG